MTDDSTKDQSNWWKVGLMWSGSVLRGFISLSWLSAGCQELDCIKIETKAKLVKAVKPRVPTRQKGEWYNSDQSATFKSGLITVVVFFRSVIEVALFVKASKKEVGQKNDTVNIVIFQNKSLCAVLQILFSLHQRSLRLVIKSLI